MGAGKFISVAEYKLHL